MLPYEFLHASRPYFLTMPPALNHAAPSTGGWAAPAGSGGLRYRPPARWNRSTSSGGRSTARACAHTCVGNNRRRGQSSSPGQPWGHCQTTAFRFSWVFPPKTSFNFYIYIANNQVVRIYVLYHIIASIEQMSRGKSYFSDHLISPGNFPPRAHVLCGIVDSTFSIVTIDQNINSKPNI